MTVQQDTTDALSRIDHALGVQDAMPDVAGPGWRPGDPLHSRIMASVGHAAPMIDIREDRTDALGEWAPGHVGPSDVPRPWSPRCKPCEVSWVGPGPCWVCGDDDPPRPTLSDVAGRMVFMGFDGGAHDISPMVTSWTPQSVARLFADRPPRPGSAAWVRAELEASSHMARARRAYQRALLNALLSAPPPSIPIYRFGRPALRADLPEYRRRTRSRRGRSRR